MSLTGTGEAYYDSTTDTIVLQGTTSASSLTVGGYAANTYTIDGWWDCALGSLAVTGAAILGNLSINGQVGTLSATAVSTDADLQVPGGSGSITLGVYGDSPTLTAGSVGTLVLNGELSAGTSVTADAANTITVNGTVDDGARHHRRGRHHILHIGYRRHGRRHPGWCRHRRHHDVRVRRVVPGQRPACRNASDRDVFPDRSGDGCEPDHVQIGRRRSAGL